MGMERQVARRETDVRDVKKTKAKRERERERDWRKRKTSRKVIRQKKDKGKKNDRRE